MKTESNISYSGIIFEVVGESMDNGKRGSFESGDKLTAEPVTIELFKEYIGENIPSYWVVESENRRYFKQVLLGSESTVICHSLNERYKDFEIETDKISCVYCVTHHHPKPVNYAR